MKRAIKISCRIVRIVHQRRSGDPPALWLYLFLAPPLKYRLQGQLQFSVAHRLNHARFKRAKNRKELLFLL